MAYFLLAAISAFLFNTAIILQTRDAASAPAELEMRAGLLWYLARRKLWLFGTFCLISAAVIQTFALVEVSVDVMQSLTAAGVLLLPLYGRWFLNQRLRPSELAALMALVASVTVASLMVGTQKEHPTVGAVTLVSMMVPLALVPFWIARRWRDGVALSIVAGLSFTATTLLQKELALTNTTAQFIPTLIGVIVCATTGFIAEMSALQTVSPMRVAPLVLGISTALPVLAAPLLFGEHWAHPIPILIALGGVVCASGYIARSAHAKVHKIHAAS